MQNRKIGHGVVEFIKRELEMSLALLLMLGFVVGFSYASTSTSLDAGNVEIAQNTSWDGGWAFSGVKYDGLNFSSQSISGLYTVRSGYSPANLSQTRDGVKGQTEGQSYSLNLTLDQPVSGTFYLHGDLTGGVTVNGNTTASSATPIKLNTSNFTMTFKGGQVLQKLVRYAGTTAAAPQKIATMYVIPASAYVGVNQTRNFEIIALDTNGNQIKSVATVWSILEGSKFAIIDRATGALTGIAPGLVKVQASSNGATASATITVKEAPKSIAAPSATIKPEDYPGADEKVNTIAPEQAYEEVGIETKAPDTTSTQESVSNALDAFAEAQTQTATDSSRTYIPESKVQEILDTTTSNVIERAVTKITLGVTQIAQDIKEIFVGSQTTLEDGTVIQKDSAFTKIGKFIAGLFGFAGEKGDVSGASPLDIGVGSEDNLK